MNIPKESQNHIDVIKGMNVTKDWLTQKTENNLLQAMMLITAWIIRVAMILQWEPYT